MRCVAFPWIYLWGVGGDTKWCSNVNWHSTLHRLVFCKLTQYTLLGVVQQSSPCHPSPPLQLQQHPAMTWTSQRSLPKAVWKYFIAATTDTTQIFMSKRPASSDGGGAAAKKGKAGKGKAVLKPATSTDLKLVRSVRDEASHYGFPSSFHFFFFFLSCSYT